MRILPAVSAAFAIILLPAVAAADEMGPLPPLAGQESQVPPDVKITLRADWQVGDTYRIESVKERKETRNGAAKPDRSTRSITEVKVAERSDSGYVLVSTLLEADLSNFAGGRAGPEAAAALTNLFKGKSMEIATNEAGFPTGLRNAEEVVKLMRQAMDEVLALSTKDPQQQAQIRALLDRMMTPQTVEAMALKDAMIFYGLMGGSYSGGPAEVYSGEMAFPFTQTPIEAELYVLLRRIDEEKGLLNIVTQSVPNPEKLNQATAAWMTEMIRSQGQPVPDDMAMPAIKMQDSLEYVYDRAISLPREVTFRRYLGIDEANKRIELEKFRLLTP